MKLSDILKYAISISLIYALFIDYGKNIVNTFQLINIDYVLLIIFLSVMQYILSAYRWMYISKHTNLNITLKDSIKFYYISSFINNIGAMAILLPLTVSVCQKMQWHLGKRTISLKFTFLTNNILKEPYPLPIIVIPKQRRIRNDRYLQPGMLEIVNHAVIHG